MPKLFLLWHQSLVYYFCIDSVREFVLNHKTRQCREGSFCFISSLTVVICLLLLIGSWLIFTVLDFDYDHWQHDLRRRHLFLLFVGLNQRHMCFFLYYCIGGSTGLFLIPFKLHRYFMIHLRYVCMNVFPLSIHVSILMSSAHFFYVCLNLCYSCVEVGAK